MIRWSVNHPVTVTVIFILVVVLGAISLSKLGIEFLPNITLPTMMVITPYPGAGPEDVEREVTKVLEDEFSTITGLDKIEAESRENVSIITLTFKWGTDLDAVAPDVRDKIDLAMSHMPDEVEHPVLLKLSASLMPILYMGVGAKESYPYLHKIVGRPIANRTGCGCCYSVGRARTPSKCVARQDTYGCVQPERISGGASHKGQQLELTCWRDEDRYP